MRAADVATAYGLSSPAPATDKPRVAHYRRDGSDVWLRYLRSSVVGIETTSPYYTTLGGLGVGSAAADAVAAGFKWSVECRKAYRRIQGGVATYLITRGGAEGKPVSAVLIVRRQQDECPRRHG